MKVSILLPTLNRAKLLPNAIDSVLKQTFKDWEMIIINDASTDNTNDLIENYLSTNKNIRVITNHTHQGFQKSLNLALEISKGEYIARIDDDDEWTDPIKLEEQVKYLDKNMATGMVGTFGIIKDEKGAELYRYAMPIKDNEIRKKMLRRNYFIHSSVLFRKSLIEKAGGYSQKKEVINISDYDLWLKIGLLSQMHIIPKYSTCITLTKKSISRLNKLDQLKKGIKLIKQYKNKYPHYKTALILRFFVIAIFKIMSKLKNHKIILFFQRFYMKIT